VDFVKAMAPLWLVSMILLVLIIHLLFTEKPLLRVHRKHPHYGIAALGLTSLFVIILYFFHVLPVIITVIVVFVLLIWTYKLKRIFHIFDWKLFLLFVAIAFGTYAVLLLWSVGIAGLPVLFSAVGLSQVISNVPATFILSGTADWKLLALGVNIGGSGTLISSIATLIAYRYAKKYDRTTRILDFMKWGALFCILQLILVLPIIYFAY
jgi:Na+/H+ antiporter NhaD/arsenite permease-like protein